ncbi:hypothetical protein SAZ11_17885 [Streptomyces sp. FXJ1.4098]|nr:hypothetical protein [Streptomyces sp. FXJ1.4098]
MTFEDEWSKLRTDAAAGRKSTHMQLNQTDPLVRAFLERSP